LWLDGGFAVPNITGAGSITDTSAAGTALSASNLLNSTFPEIAAANTSLDTFDVFVVRARTAPSATRMR
jgi:hypothetical protein